MFSSGEATQGDAGDGEEEHQPPCDEHQPGPPGVVGEQHHNSRAQVQVANHIL